MKYLVFFITLIPGQKNSSTGVTIKKITPLWQFERGHGHAAWTWAGSMD
jgi:hypothetical protein